MKKMNCSNADGNIETCFHLIPNDTQHIKSCGKSIHYNNGNDEQKKKETHVE